MPGIEVGRRGREAINVVLQGVAVEDVRWRGMRGKIDRVHSPSTSPNTANGPADVWRSSTDKLAATDCLSNMFANASTLVMSSS